MSFKLPPIEAEAVCQTEPTAEAELIQRSITPTAMREIVHIQAGQCGNQIGTKVRSFLIILCVF